MSDYIKIINEYGGVLEKYAGYMVINEKHLPYKKDDIKKAIKYLKRRLIHYSITL